MEDFDPAAATAAYLATMTPEQHERAVAYTQGGYWLMLGGFVVGLVVAWLIVRSNLLTGLRDRLNAGKPRPNVTALVVGLLFLLLNFVLSLPWSIYANWHREKAYGLNNQTLAEWLGEAAIASGIGVIAFSLFLVALYALIRHTRRTWWIWGAALTVAFLIIGLVLSPIFIEPLFNTYTPAPQGAVREAVVELAHKTGTPDDKIYIYDGTRQSDRYTANVSGLFGSARVALSDAMFKKDADMQEIRAVVGHEMGHYVRNHILWSTAVYALLTAIAFWLVERLFPVFKRLLGAGRVRDIADPAGLPVLAVTLSVIGLLATPATNSITRVMETDADRFSLEHADEPDGMAKALIKTAEYRAPSPTPLEEVVFYTHPSVENRIRMSMEWKAKRLKEDPLAYSR